MKKMLSWLKKREAKYFVSSKFSRYLRIFSGRAWSSINIASYSLFSTVPSRSARYNPTRFSAANWVE